jgi:hypothetical protein
MIPAASPASFRVPVPDDEILAEARKRYQTATNYSAENRSRFKAAMRFAGGAQWDDRLKAARESQMRPCLTMDRLGTHINQVVNDQRQSKPAIKVHPVDDVADVETAEIYNGVIRNIEHMSNAPMVYETASFTQVAGGQGVWRVLTQYSDDKSFEQDITLRRVLDPTSVTFDPDAKEMDASDGRYAFVEERKSRDVFKAEYPDVDPNNWPTATDDAIGWYSADSVLCAEYYRVIHKPTTLFLLTDGTVMDAMEFAKSGREAEVQNQRPAKLREVQWFKIAGNSVVDSRVWPGKWIPLVRIVGNEMVLDGKIIYTGLAERAYDAQRMYNYQVSTMVEMLSLQKTAPYIGAVGQFKGQEQKWARANVTNAAYLEYTPVDLNGQLAPAPQRQPAPQVPTGNVQAMQAAAQDLQWITGQHAANFGAPSNETSGRAITARQHEGDTATYHYLDNSSRGVLHTGRILVDLIPKVMDARQILRILGEDGTASIVRQDPAQPEAKREIRLADGVQKIYNLGVGRYDVAVAVGPSFGTLRQEAVEAMSTLLQGNPALWQAVGDLFVRNQNWPGAQEMADRLAKMVPPELKAEENSEDQSAQLQQALQQASQMLDQREQALQQAGQMIDQAQAEMQKMQEQLAIASDKANAEKIKADAEIYKADAEVEIARIQSAAGNAQGVVQQGNSEIAEMRQLLAILAAKVHVQMPEMDEPQEIDDAPGEKEMLLQQLAEGQQMLGQVLANGQQQTAEALAQLAQAMQNRAPTVVSVRRDENGNIIGAVAE